MSSHNSKSDSLVEARDQFEQALTALKGTLHHQLGLRWKTGMWTGVAVAVASGFFLAQKLREVSEGQPSTSEDV